MKLILLSEIIQDNEYLERDGKTMQRPDWFLVLGIIFVHFFRPFKCDVKEDLNAAVNLQKVSRTMMRYKLVRNCGAMAESCCNFNRSQNAFRHGSD